MRTDSAARFVARKYLDRAYLDMSLPIGDGQTISPPMFVAYMTEQSDPQSGDRVLEIGTGSGYQAAVAQPPGQRGLFDRNRRIVGKTRGADAETAQLCECVREDR